MKVYNSSKMYGEREIVKEAQRAETVILLRPLFTVGQWFGLFPLELNLNEPDRALYQNKCSINYIRSVIIFIITSFYVGFHLTSMVISIWSSRSVVEIIGQSLWFQGSIVSYLVAIQLLYNPHPLINLYTTDWRAVELECGNVFTSPNVRRFMRRCIIAYSALGIVSASLVAVHSYQIPQYPAYVLHYVHISSQWNFNLTTSMSTSNSSGNYPFSTVVLAIHTGCQTWFLLWKWIGSAMLDISLCLYGYVVANAMEATLNQVNGILITRDKDEEAQVVCQDHSDPGICPKGKLLNCSLKPGDVGSIVTTNGVESDKHESWTHRASAVENTYTVKMMGLLHEFQQLSQLVSDVNKAAGPLLLIAFGQLVLMICALIFLPIKYSQEFQWENSTLFAGNACVFIFRLVMLTICLGDVYPAGIEVNVRIAKFMVSEPKRLDPAIFRPIMGHLNVFSANPICFNAWGFFAITRGTLLASLSVISTYIVVLLQVK